MGCGSGVKFVFTCVFLCFLFLPSEFSLADNTKLPQVGLNIERVALFKNGLGFVTSTASLPKDASAVCFGQIPVPSYGSFWVGYPESLKVRSLVTSLEEREKQASPQTFAELLQANPGRSVSIVTGPEGKTFIDGTIIQPVTTTKEIETPSPYIMEARRRRDGNLSYSPSRPFGNLVLIKTGNGTVALNQSSIVSAEFLDKDVLTTVPIIEKIPSIRMELEHPSGGEVVSVSYLARGITWAPSYLVDLSDTETASLSAQALIMNELADLKDVNLDLVTGFPNIKFGEVLNPIAMSENLSQFLNSLARGRTENRNDSYGGGMVTQQARISDFSSAYDFETPPVPGYSTAAQGLVSEDLFLYPVEHFSLKKGETAWVPLFTAKLPYKHIYTWKVPDSLFDERKNQPDPNQPVDTAPEVWHSCRLTNNLELPLTTAPAEFTYNGGFTGQDVCYYTAPGAETTIRMNQAMNLLAEENEIEIVRKPNAASFHGWQFDSVKVQGELKVRSRMDKPVKVEVTKELSGEVLDSSPTAKDTATAKGLKEVNPKHVLTWEIEVKPGDEHKLTYSHELYVRN